MYSRSQYQISMSGTASVCYMALILKKIAGTKLSRCDVWSWTGLHWIAKCVYRKQNWWLLSMMFCERNDATFTIVYMFQHAKVYITATVSNFIFIFCCISYKKPSILVYNRQINTTTKLWTTEQVTKHTDVFSQAPCNEKKNYLKTKENCSNLTPEQEPHTLKKLKLSQPFFGLSTQTLSSKVFFFFVFDLDWLAWPPYYKFTTTSSSFRNITVMFSLSLHVSYGRDMLTKTVINILVKKKKSLDFLFLLWHLCTIKKRPTVLA